MMPKLIMAERTAQDTVKLKVIPTIISSVLKTKMPDFQRMREIPAFQTS
jgi:hypothetical protein